MAAPIVRVGSTQYGRVVELVVGSGTGQAVDVTDLRIDFKIVKTITPEPNSAIIKVYNFSNQNEAFIKAITNSEYVPVVLNAGYEDSLAVIFKGTIKNTYHYGEGADRVTEIQAGDGDKDYHKSVMNLTLAAGTSDLDLINAAVSSFTTTTLGYVGVPQRLRSRGHALFGGTRHILNTLARAHNAHWSIQDGKLTLVPSTGVLPQQAIVLNAETGMIDVPQLSSKGIIVKALINPQFKCNGTIQLNNDDIKFTQRPIHPHASHKLPGALPTPKKTQALPKLNPDGLYKAIRVDLNGSNRGKKFEAELTCIGLGQPIPQSGVAAMSAGGFGDGGFGE